jgi:predicted molibdopterin-dependent oxidoreductase YjgC
MADIAEHAAGVFLIGSNVTEQHPVFGTKLRPGDLAAWPGAGRGRPSPH